MSLPTIDPVPSSTPSLSKPGVTVDVVNTPRRVRYAFTGYEPSGSPALAFVVACAVVAVVAAWVTA